jgi:integrase
MTRRSRGVYLRRQYWYFKYKREDGNWVEHATRTTDYQQALAIRAAFLIDLKAGCLPNDRGRWTLEQVATKWLDDRQLRVASGTYRSERSIARNLLRVLGADTTLLNVADIHAVRRYESLRLREGVSAKTVNNEVLVLAALLREANLWHRVAVCYKALKVQSTDVGDALSRDETCKLIQIAQAAAPSAVAPFAALLSYSTGMRIKEIKQLRLGSIHVDTAKPFLQVRRSTTKTDRGARYVALDKIACWAMKKLLLRAKMLGAVEPEHCLFPTLREKHTRKTDPLYGGAGYDPTHPQSSWDKEWNEVRRLAGINRRFHDLRHSYITRAAEAGVPLLVTQAQVGHMTAGMTAHYTHVCQAAIHDAAEQIEKNSSELLTHFDFSDDGAETSSRTQQT